MFVTFGFVAAIIVGCLASLSFQSSLQTFLSIIGKSALSPISLLSPSGVFAKKDPRLGAESQAFHDADDPVGYWTIIHVVVVLEEHFIFRKGRWSMYDLDAWADPSLLPFGWGAIGAFCFGFAAAALGMKVSWYTAPIAGLIGGGANIGFELTLGFTALAFPILRWLEIRLAGK